MPRTKPILFSGPMNRALLDGRKTQTRRVLKPQPPDGLRFVGIYGPDAVFEPLSRGDDYTVRLPYMPGDLLWVRETWSGDYWLKDAPPSERPQICAQVAHVPKIPRTWYWADGSPTHGDWERPRPSIHMPRWASRLTLEVTAVRVQRLQEISIEDARAEGVATEEWDDWRENVTSIAIPEGSYIENERDLFRDLWDSINAKRGYGWDTNPWVCAISFIVHQMNIDEFLAQREAA